MHFLLLSVKSSNISSDHLLYKGNVYNTGSERFCLISNTYATTAMYLASSISLFQTATIFSCQIHQSIGGCTASEI